MRVISEEIRESKIEKGDVDNGLIFCGDNVGRINKITTVHSLMKELTE